MNRSEQVEFERQYLTQVQIFRYGYQDERKPQSFRNYASM